MIDELNCTITVFAYDGEKGTLTEVEAVSTLPEGESVKPGYSGAEIVLHPSGRWLYESNRGHDSIGVFAIDPSSGRLSPIQHVSSGGHIPRNFNLDPTGRFLLAANQESGNVVEFRVDPGMGRLAPTGVEVKVGKPVCVVFVRAR